jgi:hypothetical protein
MASFNRALATAALIAWLMLMLMLMRATGRH